MNPSADMTWIIFDSFFVSSCIDLTASVDSLSCAERRRHQIGVLSSVLFASRRLAEDTKVKVKVMMKGQGSRGEEVKR